MMRKASGPTGRLPMAGKAGRGRKPISRARRGIDAPQPAAGEQVQVKRIAQALKESEQRYALATQAATAGIYEWNLATGSLFLSDRSKAFFGVKGDTLTPATWNKRVHEEDYPGYRDALRDFFKSGRK